jgi:hypothetical protein
MVDRKNGLTYADSGVDIDAGNRLVDLIKPMVRATARPGADAEIGGFGGLFDLKAAGFKDPVLVAATDGVGTKVKIAIETGLHGGIGIDLVAMSVNDLVVQGANRCSSSTILPAARRWPLHRTWNAGKRCSAVADSRSCSADVLLFQADNDQPCRVADHDSADRIGPVDAERDAAGFDAFNPRIVFVFADIVANPTVA